MTLPYPKPTTREMARKNAVYYAEEAARHMQPGHLIENIRANLETAKTWAAIALAFPEDPDIQVLMVDDRPVSSYPVLEDGPEFDPRPMAERNGFEDPDATSVMHVQPPVEPSVGHVGPSGRDGGTIVVDPIAWDVLRALAIRYVTTSINRAVTVDLADEDTGIRGWDMQFSRMPDSSVIHVSVTRA
jgi:hypothetical protein